MTINQYNSVLHAFSVPDWSEMWGVVDELTVFFIIAHPVNFDIQRERSLECDAKNSTYTYISIYIYHLRDNRYGFSISIGNTIDHVTTLTCLGWHTENMLIFPLIDDVGEYLYLKNESFKFEVDPHQFNPRWHHFSQFPFNVKSKNNYVQKLAGLWLTDKVVNHVGINGTKAAAAFSAF